MDDYKDPAASIELHIGELVLDGVAAADRHRVRDAVERELTRLMTEQGPPPAYLRAGESAHLGGVVPSFDPNGNAEMQGIRLAQAIYGAIPR